MDSRAWAIIVVIAVLFVGIRLVYLRADLPTRLPNHSREWAELIVEGPAKAQEARNKALFGTWKTNALDNYQFWRVQSPVWVYPLSWSFRAFGVGYAQLRLHSILTAALALLAVMLIAAQRLAGWSLFASGLLIALNYYYVFFCRAGLLEPMLNSMLAVTVLCLLMALTTPLWLIGAQVAFALAFLTKQSALVLLPLLLIVTVWSVVRARRSRQPTSHWVLPLASLAVITIGLVLYVCQEAYWRTVIWNFEHVLLSDARVGKVDVSRVPFGKIFDRLASWKRWRNGFFLLMPAAAPLILIDLTRMVVSMVRQRRVDPWDALAALWFLSVFASLQLTSLKSVRFLIMLIPPGALLAASGLQTLLRLADQAQKRWLPERTPKLTWVVLAAVIGVVGATHGRWFVGWVSKVDYVLADTNRDIEAQIGEREAVVLGAWAAPLVFDTPYQTYYVKSTFNKSREALESMNVTHLLVRNRSDWTYRFIKKTFPDAARRAKTVKTYDLWRGISVDLRPLDRPLGQDGARR